MEQSESGQRHKTSTLDEFRSKRIKIFRNGDCLTAPKKFVVSTRIYRNFEQFLHNVSEDLCLPNGAVRRIYSIDGAVVRDLLDLQDGGYYVGTAGEPFRRYPYPLDDEVRHVQEVAARRTIRREEQRDEDDGAHRRKDLPLFGPSSKAYRVVVFANGDIGSAPLRLVLNYRNCKSFEQLMNMLSNLVRLKTGFVRKLFDAETGARLRILQDLKDGQNLVAATWDNFIKSKYPLQNPNVNQFDIKKADDTPRPATFYPNGDSYHHGFTITLKKTRFHSLKKLIDHLNSTLDLPTGRITRIFAMNGQRIENIDEIYEILAPSVQHHTEEASDEQNQQQAKSQYGDRVSFVIGCADDPFYNVPYDLNRLRSRHGAPIGLGGVTQHNEFLERIRPVRKLKQQAIVGAGLTVIDSGDAVTFTTASGPKTPWKNSTRAAGHQPPPPKSAASVNARPAKKSVVAAPPASEIIEERVVVEQSDTRNDANEMYEDRKVKEFKAAGDKKKKPAAKAAPPKAAPEQPAAKPEPAQKAAPAHAGNKPAQHKREEGGISTDAHEVEPHEPEPRHTQPLQKATEEKRNVIQKTLSRGSSQNLLDNSARNSKSRVPISSSRSGSKADLVASKSASKEELPALPTSEAEVNEVN